MLGFRLFREIISFAPADWTPGEMVVALVIADDARDSSRRSWISNAELCFRSRLKPSAVRKHLTSLGARGFEFRVIHGYGKNGAPVFAAKGHAVDYLIPDMFKGATDVAASAVAAARKGATIRPEGATDVAALNAKGATDVAPLPSKNLTPPRNPSVDPPVVTPSVEGTREPQGQQRDIGSNGHRPEPQDEYMRHQNALTEWENSSSLNAFNAERQS